MSDRESVLIGPSETSGDVALWVVDGPRLRIEVCALPGGGVVAMCTERDSEQLVEVALSPDGARLLGQALTAASAHVGASIHG